ncbi:LysR family transcriptional regulator [Streptomyces sp. NPDC057611]|uniref:LysR family transcriptional regulator n=1 Tax=Streptomyces sp. NPDC057611 TaxID=3346182 RepID=UPI00367BD3A2
MSMDVELRHLRAFTSVARHLSFSRAAEELLITQPALSRTIAQLEGNLNVRLLDRSSRHVELTATGAEFLLHAERVLATLDQALAVVRHKVTLRLGFSWLLPDPWAQQAVSHFEQDIGASVTLTRTDDPLQALRQRAVDIALVRGDFDPPWAARTVHLYDEPRIAVCSEHCDLVRLGHLGWADVQHWPLVVNTARGGAAPHPAPRPPFHSAHRGAAQPGQPCLSARRSTGPGPPVPGHRPKGGARVSRRPGWDDQHPCLPDMDASRQAFHARA